MNVFWELTILLICSGDLLGPEAAVLFKKAKRWLRFGWKADCMKRAILGCTCSTIGFFLGDLHTERLAALAQIGVEFVPGMPAFPSRECGASELPTYTGRPELAALLVLLLPGRVCGGGPMGGGPIGPVGRDEGSPSGGHIRIVRRAPGMMSLS
ncbi:hypothetical protein PG988_006290 [Apiospora saccharicola]